jgi:hypothetical protein
LYDYNEPRRDEVRHAQPEVGKHRARKNTRRWCRGKSGVEHKPVVQLTNWGERHRTTDSTRTCHWDQHWRRVRDQTVKSGPWYWYCDHEEVCSGCGKILDSSPCEKCPEWIPKPSTTESKAIRELLLGEQPP